MWHIKAAVHPHLICDVNCNIQVTCKVLIHELYLEKQNFCLNVTSVVFFCVGFVLFCFLKLLHECKDFG